MSRRLLCLTHLYWRISNKNFKYGKSMYNFLKTSNAIVKTPGRLISHSSENIGLLDDTVSFNLDDIDVNKTVQTLISYDTNDPVIYSMLAANTVQDIFNIMDNPVLDLKTSHQVQAILMLWYFQHIYLKVQTQLGTLSEDTEAQYLQELHQRHQFQKLLNYVTNGAENYDIDELSCSLLYLSKMNVDFKSCTMQNIIFNIERKFKMDPVSASLTALSRCSVAFKYSYDLSSQYFLLGLVPHIQKHMQTNLCPEDFKLLTTCITHTNQILPDSMLDRYVEMCRGLLADSILKPEHGKVAVRILTVLSLSFWTNKNGDLFHKICKTIEPNIKNLEANELVALSKAMQTHLEPASMVEKVSDAAKEYLNNVNAVFDKNVRVGLLTAASQLSFNTKKIELEKMLLKELENKHFSYSLLGLFQILRSIKTANQTLCNLYWLKIIELLRNETGHPDPKKLIRVAHRYMYFNNNMGGTFRNFAFENQMIAWLLDEIKYGTFAYVPAKQARSAGFIIAYCRDLQIILPVIDNVLKVATQLCKIDCVMLSRGIEIMLELSRRKPLPTEAVQKLVDLDTAMNKCAWRHLNENTLTIADITTLLRTFFNRRASPDSLLFNTIIEKIKTSEERLNSRLIRDLSFCTTGLNYLIPSLVDKMSLYIVKNEDAVFAETAERVLTTSYYLGYCPLPGTAFLDTCCRLLQRDMNRLPSLVIIQISLALTFFHAFPSELVNTIFSVDFLERIDDELATCYSKATYPLRVRYTLMELNRSVCLDRPELDVPWFHAKYCEELAALDPNLCTSFHEEVRKQLITIVGDKNLIQTGVYSPYGYKINFLIQLDSHTKPLEKSEEKNTKDRVAFILHSDNQFTLGDRRLKGSQQLRQRHLEMLGYRVVSIPEHVWNSMSLTEDHAKRSFLAQNLWPER